jgi:hypothetical protein
VRGGLVLRCPVLIEGILYIRNWEYYGCDECLELPEGEFEGSDTLESSETTTRYRSEGNRLMIPFILQEVDDVLQARWIPTVVFWCHDDDPLSISDDIGYFFFWFCRIHIVLEAFMKYGIILLSEIEDIDQNTLSFQV